MRPAKLKNIMRVVAGAVRAGRLRYSFHASLRMKLRQIIKPEVESILLGGFHEAREDHFSEEHGDWDYAIRGKTVDGRNLRLVVAMENPSVLIVTAIDLDSED